MVTTALLLADDTTLTQLAEVNRADIGMLETPNGHAKVGKLKSPPCLVGSPRTDTHHNETPQHSVRIPAFQLGKTEVTIGQFKQFITDSGRSDLMNENFRKYNSFGDDTPVVRVSWNDAQDFITWLNQTEGKGHRLPSEAEWEYACRAGGNHTFCGSNDVDSVAWHAFNSGRFPQVVASKQANAWGLHDMSGNASEWVQDLWHKNYDGAPSDGSAWISDKTSEYRVVRGGSWGVIPTYSRVAIAQVSIRTVGTVPPPLALG